MTLQQQLDKLAKDLDILDHDLILLNEGGSHPWACKCPVCKEFWKLMPPDADGMYGPFSPSELKEIEHETI